MTITSRLSRSLRLVKAFEAFHARATPQEGGFVIGYGHTASAREGAVVTRQEAEDLLLYDLGQIGRLLDAWVYAPMHDNQRQALIAFGFNVGAENLYKSTALRRLNAGDYMGCGREIERWRMADLAGRGQVVDALVRRRAAEKVLFLTPADGFLKTNSASLRPRFDGDRSAPTPAAEPPVEAASAAMAAAHNVSARLRALLPDPEQPQQTASQAGSDAVAEPAVRESLDADKPDPPELDLSPSVGVSLVDKDLMSNVMPDLDAAAEATVLDSILLDPIRLAPAPPKFKPLEPPADAASAVHEPQWRSGAGVRAMDAAPPPPPPFVAAARPRGATLVSANDYGPDGFSDEAPPPVEPAFFAEDAIASAPEPSAPSSLAPFSMAGPMVRERVAPLLAAASKRGYLFLGLFGVLLFAVSILFILTGKPSAANLTIGLVGVLCMIPTAYKLLAPRDADEIV